MTWVEMEQAITDLLTREQQWRLMLTVTLVQIGGMWLVIAALLEHGVRKPRVAWSTYLTALATFALAVTLWWVP